MRWILKTFYVTDSARKKFWAKNFLHLPMAILSVLTMRTLAKFLVKKYSVSFFLATNFFLKKIFLN